MKLFLAALSVFSAFGCGRSDQGVNSSLESAEARPSTAKVTATLTFHTSRTVSLIVKQPFSGDLSADVNALLAEAAAKIGANPTVRDIEYAGPTPGFTSSLTGNPDLESCSINDLFTNALPQQLSVLHLGSDLDEACAGTSAKDVKLTIKYLVANEPVSAVRAASSDVTDDVNKLLNLVNLPVASQVDKAEYQGPNAVDLSYSSADETFRSCDINTIFAHGLAKPGGDVPRVVKRLAFSGVPGKICRQELVNPIMAKLIIASSTLKSLTVSQDFSGNVVTDVNALLANAGKQIGSPTVKAVHYFGPVCALAGIFKKALPKSLEGLRLKFDGNQLCANAAAHPTKRIKLRIVYFSPSEDVAVSRPASGEVFSDVNSLLDSIRIPAAARIDRVIYNGPHAVEAISASSDAAFQTCDVNAAFTHSLALPKEDTRRAVKRLTFFAIDGKGC